MSGLADSGVYDLSALNRNQQRAKRGYAAGAIGLIVLCIAVVVVFMVSDLPSVLNHSITTPQLIIFIVAVPWLAIIVGMLALGLRWRRRGAEGLRVDGRGLELRFQNRGPINLSWSDTSLRFALEDYSDVPPGALSVDARFFILVSGLSSPLSAEAFQAIMAQVHAHNLPDEIHPTNRWRQPANGRVHYVSGTVMVHERPRALPVTKTE